MEEKPAPQDPQLRQELESVIHASIGWALTRDFDLLYSVIARDEDFFIFNPDNEGTVTGFTAFHAFAEGTWRRPDFHGTHFETHDLRIQVAECGTVAWYSCFLDDYVEVAGVESGWEKVRWTGVLEKRSGKWVHTQMHFSFPTG